MKESLCVGLVKWIAVLAFIIISSLSEGQAAPEKSIPALASLKDEDQKLIELCRPPRLTGTFKFAFTTAELEADVLSEPRDPLARCSAKLPAAKSLLEKADLLLQMADAITNNVESKKIASQALQVINQYLKTHPTDPAGQLQKAEILFDLDQDPEGLGICNRLYLDHPQHAPLYVEMIGYGNLRVKKKTAISIERQTKAWFEVGKRFFEKQLGQEPGQSDANLWHEFSQFLSD